MARINIEECWWSDPRRSRLIRLVGDEERADGCVIKMWRTAQEFWKRDHQLIPRSVFEALQSASELIASGLAEERENAIYVRGSSQYLEWVKDAAEAGRLGGLKSAQVRREKHGSAQPKPRSNPNPLRTPSEAFEPSVSGSGSSSSSEDLKNIYTEPKTLELNPENLEQAVKDWGISLTRFKINKNPKLDEVYIAKLIQRHGYEKTRLALLGAGLEAATDNYDPAKHISILRLQKQENFEKFVNLGSTIAIQKPRQLAQEEEIHAEL